MLARMRVAGLLSIFLLISKPTLVCPQQLLTIKLPRETIYAPFSFVPEERPARPTLGLALSGGALRGIAQIGVLQALSEHDLPIDYIAGTSIGSIIGALYASGYTPEELWSIVQSLNLSGLFDDAPSRSNQFLSEKQKQSRSLLQLRMAKGKFYFPEAVTPGQKFTNLLTDLILNAPLHESDFNCLAVPLKIVATDLLTGKKIVLQNGNIIEAMRASIAVPLLLLPVEYDHSLLVDGGLLDNLPVEETRSMGADIVLAVNCTATLRSRDEMRLPWELVDQVTTIMQQEHNLEQLKKADLVLTFQSLPTMSTQSEAIDSLYESARLETQKIIPQLKTLIAQKLKEQQSSATTSFMVHRISFAGSPQLGFSELIKSQSHQSYTVADIQSNLRILYQTGYFKDVEARIEHTAKETSLIYQLSSYPELKQIILQGNTIFSDSLLLSSFTPLLGRPLNRHHARAALQQLIHHYRTAGFSLAELKSIHFNEQTGIANVEINEGKIVRIRFEGAKITKEWVLERDFLLECGDLFQHGQAKAAVDNLIGTGLFNAVTLLPQKGPSVWEVIVRLVEKKFTVLRFGSHYNRERNGRAFIEVANENLFGTSNDITLHGQYGDRDQKLSLQFNANRVFKSSLTAQFMYKDELAKRYHYQRFLNAGEYQRHSNGTFISLGMQLARLGMLSGFMRLEKINIRTLSENGLDTGNLLVNTLGINSIVDTRDYTLYPTRGKYFTFTYEVSSGKFLGADISFFKVHNQLSTYWTWKNRNTFSPRLLWGTSDLTTPFSEQYKIGGEDSFYGLRDEQWCGRNMILGSIEYRYRLPWKNYLTLYFSTRFDFGAVWENSVDVQGSDFISGRGVALSAKTPFGPLSIAYGQASNGKERLYLSAGYSF